MVASEGEETEYVLDETLESDCLSWAVVSEGAETEYVLDATLEGISGRFGAPMAAEGVE
jgi:hypothetical protein